MRWFEYLKTKQSLIVIRIVIYYYLDSVRASYFRWCTWRLHVIFPGHEDGADLGPVISPQAKQRILDLVQSGVDEGASLLLDGRKLKVKGYENGNFVGPSVLHKVKVSLGKNSKGLH